MVNPVGLDTPQTEVGNATYMAHLNSQLDFSHEQSFISPSKDNNDLVKQMANNRRAISLKTPRSRLPLHDRPNKGGAGPGGQGEFTPLLKSVTRSNHLRRSMGIANGMESVLEE